MTDLPLSSSPGRSLWTNVSFMLMWTSVAASGFGDRLIMLASKPMLGSNEPGVSASRITAGITLAFFFPFLFLTGPGGWLADRISRKFILFGCDWSRALVLLLAWWWMGRMSVVTVPADEHWRIYAIIALTGAFAAVFNPSRFASVPQLVEGRHLQQANAVLAGIALVASLIGQKAGEKLIGDGSKVDLLRLAVFVGFLSYAVSGPFFLFMHLRGGSKTVAEPEPLRRQLFQAFAYLRTHRAVRRLVLLNVFFWCCAWVLYAAISSLAKNRYGLEASKFIQSETGLLLALGAGMLSASVVVVLLVRARRESSVIAMASLFLAALCMVALAFCRSYPLAQALTFGAGLFGGVFLVLVDTLTQTLTPDHVRGRVFGVRSMLDTCATVAINLVIWRMPEADADRVVIVIFTAVAGALVLVAGYSVYRQLLSGPMNSPLANLLWHAVRVITLNWHQLRWYGRRHIPRTGRVILAANHTTGLDPFVMQSACPRMVRWVMLRWYRFKVLGPLWRAIDPILVDHDAANLASLREMIRELQRDDAIVGIFPEGGLQREVRELKPFQPGIGFLARKSGAVIVPVWIAGTPRLHHMFWHFACPSRSVVAFGEPYRPSDQLSNDEIAQELRRRMLELGALVESWARGDTPPPPVAD